MTIYSSIIPIPNRICTPYKISKLLGTFGIGLHTDTVKNYKEDELLIAKVLNCCLEILPIVLWDALK